MTDTPNDQDLEQLLAAIAHKHFSIRTLATRGNDGPDFHQAAVWSVREALRAAYEAGQK